MNRLALDERVRILSALVEGYSVRGTSRVVGVDKKTVLRLLADVGDSCEAYFDEHVRGLNCDRLQLDEIWSFCQAKERNLPRDLRGAGLGDLWTWTGIDADTKLIVTWHLGKRLRDDANAFVRDLSERIVSHRVQVTTDGYGAYAAPIRRWFEYRADHSTDVKDFGHLDDESPERKYSPMVVKDVTRKALWGVPDPDYMSTSYAERQNLTMRKSMRRFTRLSSGFSKKALNVQRALAISFMFYNYCRVHSTTKTTPARKAGLTDNVWTMYEIAKLSDEKRNHLVA